ncbi:GSCFA domain-containing protein [Novispirillum sp. DQ9]|uniref:GSCFA domain-containing protein n=1 Tax=Novispirillum sp. DQ9 TaxID=3398612 RepID=UPI003C7C4F2F
MTNPYQSLPASRFWRTGTVALPETGLLEDIYKRRFAISRETRIATAGSCFAQHIGRELRVRGFGFMDYEPAPALLPGDRHAAYGYGLYSCRYGNIYTVAQLRQLLHRAFGADAGRLGSTAPDAAAAAEVWRMGDRFADPFRPTIQEGGFASRDEVLAARDTHLRAVRRLFLDCEVFTFTLGLTETWAARRDGTVYPVCPGTVAGEFSHADYVFKNFSFSEVHEDLRRCVEFLRDINPSIRILLTVSPVPLTATASEDHILPATTYSKAVLRAVAGEIRQAFDCVDYFPSFELVTTHVLGGSAFEANRRTVRKDMVSYVMRHFFHEHGVPDTVAVPTATQTGEPEKTGWQDGPKSRSDVLCDEEILEAFNER